MPDQIAVVGFGDPAIAGDMRPSITTVDVDGARIGREAVSVLRRRAAGEQITQRVIDAGFRLIARKAPNFGRRKPAVPLGGAHVVAPASATGSRSPATGRR